MIAVTGGLGFIGNELVRQLNELNHEIVIFDNRNRVAPQLEDLNAIQVVDIDITNHDKLTHYFKEIRPSQLYHLAAIHYIPECNENPERTLRINVEGTQSVLRAAADAGVEKVVFASSGAVYADDGKPLNENSSIGPVDIYGWSKLFSEQLCALACQNFDLDIVIARLFNNYGPRETNPHIIPEILNQLRTGNKLSLGKITTIRDYIHTRDCAKALIKLMNAETSKMQTVNVATGSGYSVLQIIETIKQILQREIEVHHDSQRVRKFDKQSQIADISQLIEITKWRPEIGIAQGLTDLLQFEGLK